jgi:hypothetical protein
MQSKTVEKKESQVPNDLHELYVKKKLIERALNRDPRKSPSLPGPPSTGDMSSLNLLLNSGRGHSF